MAIFQPWIIGFPRNENIPFKKEDLQVIGIDFSKRLADVNPQDNFMEIK